MDNYNAIIHITKSNCTIPKKQGPYVHLKEVACKPNRKSGNEKKKRCGRTNEKQLLAKIL